MSRRIPFRPFALSLLLLFPAPLFALLCRGHSPSRFETANLPVWERRPPLSAPPCRLFRLLPPPPGTIQVSPNPWMKALLQVDENQLLSGIEHPGMGDSGAAGKWLEDACAWGPIPPVLTGKQDRVALRLMAAQSETGTFGQTKSPKIWSPQEVRTQQSSLRGLLAYYALTRRPAAIYAALSAGNRMVRAAQETPDPGWVYPLTRLFQASNDPQFLVAARRQAALSDGLGLCALYEATGQPAYLQSAQQAWARGPTAPDLAAELLLLTGRPGYAAALARLPAAGSNLARVGWTRVPLGLAVNTDHDSTAAFHGVQLDQRTEKASRTITVHTAAPKAFALRIFLPPGTAPEVRVNDVVQTAPTPPGGYATLLRRWRSGDKVIIFYPHSQTARR